MNFRTSNETLTNYNYNSMLRLLLVTLAAAIVMVSFSSLASSIADPIGGVLCNLIKVFRGNTAKGIAIIGIIVLGIQTLRGKLQWEVALVIITAIIILFKAPDIVNMISSDVTTKDKCGVTNISTSP
ncbi:MAG: TrbC/VirB2 family protein [Rickettsia endosymbiont of Argas persicus]